MKTVLFVPGFKENIDSRDYRSVIQAIESRGYTAIFIPIQWKHTTIDEWVLQLNDIYRTYSPKDTILAGFSFGAMTAFISASQTNPSELWLFSLSPYFSDDIDSVYMKQIWLNEIGIHRVDAFKNLDFTSLTAKITCPIKLFAGSKELSKYKVMGERFNIAQKTLNNCSSFVIEGVGHNVEHPNYIQAISENI